MKARLAVLSSLALLAAPLAAQGGGGSARGGNPMSMLEVPATATLTEQLTLTPEQVTKVTVLSAAYDSATAKDRAAVAKVMEAGDMQALRGNESFTKVREARTKFATDLKAILTKDQAAKYDELYPTRGRRPSGN